MLSLLKKAYIDNQENAIGEKPWDNYIEKSSYIADGLRQIEVFYKIQQQEKWALNRLYADFKKNGKKNVNLRWIQVLLSRYVDFGTQERWNNFFKEMGLID